jgi:hypothetical protein
VDDKLELVIRTLKSMRNKYIIGFLFIFAFGVAAVVGGIVEPEEMGTGAICVGVFFLLLAAFGVTLILPVLNPRNSPLMKLICDTPERIAWLYSSVSPGSRGAMKTFTIYIHDVDKKMHSFIVKPKHLDELMETIKGFAPRATVGYTDELAKQFQADPWSLIEDAGEAGGAPGGADAKDA